MSQTLKRLRSKNTWVHTLPPNIEQLEAAIASRKRAFGPRLEDDWDDAAFNVSVEIKLAEEELKRLRRLLR